jgi:hypothetical protein
MCCRDILPRMLVSMWSGCIKKVTVGDKEGVIQWGLWGCRRTPHLLQQADIAEVGEISHMLGEPRDMPKGIPYN